MKMSFRPDKSLINRHPGWRVSRRQITVLVLLFAVGLFGHAALRGGLESPALKLAYPWLLANKLASGGAESWAAYLSRQETLAKENLTLKAENEALRLEVLAGKQVGEDYRSLRATLGESVPAAGQTLAKVILAPNRSPFDVLVVDLGKDNSRSVIGTGDLVRSGNIALGTIASVSAYTAKVKLFSTPGEEVSAVIGPDKVPATLVGRGGGNFRAELPRGVTLALGDLALLPAWGDKIVAEVGAVDNDPEEPIQTVYLKSPVNLFTLAWLWIDAR